MSKSVALLLILVLTSSSTVSLLPVKAEYNGDITINADGSANPSTAPLEQAGNVYSLTNDINGTITVNNKNITLDGNNHKLTVPSIFTYGITLNNVSNVTVANFAITGGAKGIDIHGTANTVANSTITEADNGVYSLSQPTAAIALTDASSTVITGNKLESSRVGLILYSGQSKQCSNNQIVGNNFIDCSIAIIVYDSSNNRFYHNNFFNNNVLLQDSGYYGYSLPSFNVWDDGHHFGNYWSDYLVRYPNATEIDATGVGDTPYFVKPNNYVDPATLSRQEAKDYWTHMNAQYANNTDHYPLMQPFMAAPSPTAIPTPQQTTEPFPTVPVAVASVTVVAVVIAGLLFYFKKRKREAEPT
jgi:parallel beta-helix repeat protein